MEESNVFQLKSKLIKCCLLLNLYFFVSLVILIFNKHLDTLPWNSCFDFRGGGGVSSILDSTII